MASRHRCLDGCYLVFNLKSESYQSTPRVLYPLLILLFLSVSFPTLLRAQSASTYSFERIDSGDGLSHNSVFAILQDRQGFLWLGTQDGLNRYDGYGFRVFRHDPNDSASLSSNAVFALAEDADGALWIGTRGALNRYDPSTNSFSTFRPEGTEMTIIDMTFDDKGMLWTKGVPDAVVHQFDPRTGIFSPYQSSAFPGPSSSRVKTVRSIIGYLGQSVLEDASGQVWVGTTSGLHTFDTASQRLVPMVLTEGVSSIAQDVRALYQDQAGTLWVGTLSGLYRHDPNLKPFHFIRPVDYLDEPQDQSPIMSIAQDSQGKLWLGMLGGGVMQMDLADRSARGYTLPHPTHPAEANQVWYVHVDSGDIVWLGTTAGLASFDPNTTRFLWHDPPHPQRDDISLIVPGFSEHQLVVGGMGGIHQVDRGTGQRELLVGADKLGLATSTWVEFLWLDKANQRIWMLSGHTGLIWVDVPTQHISVPSATLNQSLAEHTGVTIHPANDGTYWVTTENGLRRFSIRSGSYDAYFAPPDLPGTIIYSLLEDKASGQFWMGTNQGVARFDPGTGRYRHYDVPGQVEFNRRSALQLSDGRMLFGGLDGITVFNPHEIRDNTTKPPVVITQVQKSNQAGTTTLHPAFDTPLTLRYDDNSMAITYAALNFTKAHKNQYRYRLAGLEKGWHDAGTRRRVDYANLPPGRYTFEVQGSNNDGLWNEEGATLALIIRPPFWQTWWFRLLVLMLVSGLLYAIYRYRVGQWMEMERLRLRIASDLHDDIGSKLSGMALMSELLEAEPSLSEEARTDLRELGTSTREIIGDLRDIVWFIDPDHDQAGKTLEKMQQAARRLLGGIDYTFDASGAQGVEQAPMAFRRNLYLIHKEALNNIVHHAKAHNVVISLAVDTTHVRLQIEDDGVGFDLEAVDAGSGLKNMQRRTTEMNGTLTLKRCPKAGMTLTLTAPMP